MNKNRNVPKPVNNHNNMNNKKPVEEDDDIIMNTEQFIGNTFDNLNNVICALEDKNRKTTAEMLAYKKAFEVQKFKTDEMEQKYKMNQDEIDKNKLHNINKRSNREVLAKKLDSLYKIKDKNREEDILKKADELFEKLMKGEQI